MSLHTHITIADRGWILEKLAREIAIRSNTITYGTEPNPSADLHYYINYSCRRRRAGPVEIAFFTHSERDEAARKRYFDIAADVEHSVCMSRRYADELKAAGIKDVTTITPGVDLDSFTPKVRVGVIGRTYHTGRKGEALVAEMMDIPGIEWRFTGEGWPGPSHHIEDSQMPDFYNGLDYVLVPALYEGGPMCILEALACGKPVIASDVGWVDEYPHIAFENGNADSLRNVLTQLVDERLKLRESVAHRTWSDWGDSHLGLFEKVARQHGITGKTAAAKTRKGAAPAAGPEKMTALLLTHGGEGKTLGGPSVRVPRTASELARIGVGASLAGDGSQTQQAADLVHLFNCWPQESAYEILSAARDAGKPTVYSPIFLDLTHRETFSHTVPALLSGNRKNPAVVQAGLAAIRADMAKLAAAGPREPFSGYAEKLAAGLNCADHLIFLSEHERCCVEHLVGLDRPYTILRNPVDTARFDGADPDQFRNAHGLDQYILCVGRIEPRKNQLVLAYAARKMDIPVVFIGHEGNASYGRMVHEMAPEGSIFVPRIEPNDPMLASAFTGASAFCLPSWAEGAPLSALEACSAGVPLVLSDQSSEPEYFGELARYVNPADPDGLRAALEAAVAESGDEALRKRRKALARDSFPWDKHAQETAAVYRTALEAGKVRAVVADTTKEATKKIYVDLTTSWHHSGHPTGIARVEERCLTSLLNVYGDRVIPIVWNSKTHTYLRLSIQDALSGGDTTFLTELERNGKAKNLLNEPALEPGRLLIFGGAWFRNATFIASLRHLKLAANLNITLLVHDIIQLTARHLYPADATATFESNLAEMVASVDSFLAYSDATIRDLSGYLSEQGVYFKPIHKFRLGDMRSEEDLHGTEVLKTSELCRSLEKKDFVIYVSSLDLRKNHVLLINVWRRLIQQRGNKAPQLLLIGRSMWQGEQILDMVRAEPALSSKVQFLQDVCDEELHWLYRNCKFTVYPSLIEGWGLPVAESLANGKVCLASNSTSTAEIAPELTELLDPYDFKAWVDKVGFLIDNPASLTAREKQIRDQFTFIEWDESVRQIVTSVDHLPLHKVRPPVIWSQSVLSFRDASPAGGLADSICTSGWARRERSGRWTVQKTASLQFRTPVSASGKLNLRLLLSSFVMPGHSARQVRIRIADQTNTLLMVPARPSFADFELDITQSDLADSGCAEIMISFETEDTFSPKMVSNSTDGRMLGICLSDLAIHPDESALDRLIAAEGKMRVQTVEDYVEPLQAAPQPTPASHGMTPGQAKALALALAMLDAPTRLEPSNAVFRSLRFLKADIILLKIYGKLTGRTHDALRRTISAIVNHDNKPV